jgi:hypothetical protein
MLYSEALSSWTIGGTASVTPDAIISPDDTLSMDLVTVNNGANTVSETATGFTASANLATSFWIKRSSTTDYLEVENASDATLGLWTINMARLPDEKIRITPLNITDYGVINTAFTATAGGAGGIKFRSSAAVDVSAYIWGTHQENGKYSTSYIKTTTGVGTTNREVISHQPFLNTGITGIGHGYQYKKIIFEFDMNPSWNTVGNTVAPVALLRFITSPPDTYIAIYCAVRTSMVMDLITSDLTSIYSAKNISALMLTGWHKYKIVIDFLSTANCKVYLDNTDLLFAVPGYTNKALVINSTTTLYTCTNNFSITANAGIRNFKMWLET